MSEPALRRGGTGPVVRIAVALVLAGIALLLAWPGPVAPRGRTWEDLLAPLHVGRAVPGFDFEIAALRRGEEHDVVLTLRRATAEGAVEVHVLDRGRWPGIRETASFGVAYEAPRSSAAVPECEALTEGITGALRANDSGGLGPVDAIPLRAEPDPPAIARALDQITGVRGLAVGLFLAAATWLFASGPVGGVAAGVWLFVLGLMLRAPHLDVPFVRDQDVQRLFTGHLPLREILTGQGLADRHPPLYFLVLHVAQFFGQSESAVRAPAVLAGVLLGPALVWAAWALRRRVDVGAMAGLAAVLSVELIGRSREVSSIPLFGLLALVMAVALVRHPQGPSPKWSVALIASLALALWTYYIAGFAILGILLGLFLSRRLSLRTLRTVAVGVALGAPALFLGVATFVRDRGARATADVHPTLAWGSHGPLEMAKLCLSAASGAFGPMFAILFVVAVAWAIRRRQSEALVPALGLATTFLGICALAPVARVQPYYIVAVLPLLLLTLIVVGSDIAAGRKEPWLGAAALGAVVAATQAPHLHAARTHYLPDSDAFMPAFASVIEARTERRVITVAHYDTTLLSYYLARHAGVPMDWSRMKTRPDGAFRLEGLDIVLQPLLHAHSLGADPGRAAEETLRTAMVAEPILVVSREAFSLPAVNDVLRRCDVIAQAGTGRLFRCAAKP